MARYCDLDALIETFEERNRNTCNGSLTCLQLIRILKTTPVVDVVPREIYVDMSFEKSSTIRRLEQENLKLNAKLEVYSERK